MNLSGDCPVVSCFSSLISLCFFCPLANSTSCSLRKLQFWYSSYLNWYFLHGTMSDASQKSKQNKSAGNLSCLVKGRYGVSVALSVFQKAYTAFSPFVVYFHVFKHSFLSVRWQLLEGKSPVLRPGINSSQKNLHWCHSLVFYCVFILFWF